MKIEDLLENPKIKTDSNDLSNNNYIDILKKLVSFVLQ